MRLRIATANLENFGERPGQGLRLEDRIAVLRPMLERLEADILCLQEVDGQHRPGRKDRELWALDRLLAGTAYEGFERFASQGAKGGGVADKHNLVTLSRWPFAETRRVRHDYLPPLSYRPLTAEPPSQGPQSIEWDRPLLLTAVALPNGQRLHIVNLHLRAPLAAPVEGQKSGPFTWRSVGGWAEGFFIATLKRGGQALEARLLVESLLDRDPGALIALCGDFNAEASETPLRLALADAEETGNEALGVRSLHVLEGRLARSRRYSVIHGGRHVMLDHILASTALKARFRTIEVDNEAIGDELLDEEAGVERLLSHHAPLVASFELGKAGAPD